MGCAAFVHDEHGCMFTFAREQLVRITTIEAWSKRLLRIGAHEGQHAVQVDRGESPTPGDKVFGTSGFPDDLALEEALGQYLTLESEVEARGAEELVTSVWSEYARRCEGETAIELDEERGQLMNMFTASSESPALFRISWRNSLLQS
jgi:hypothetical protein